MGQRSLRVRVKSVLVAASVSMTLLTLQSQALHDRPGLSRPVQPRTPRIAPIADAMLTAAHRERIAKFVAPGTRPGNGIRTLLNVPELVDHTMSFHTYITRDASLPPRDRELLMLRTAWLHGSDVI
ncbi:MAG TPA: carboxymuconolactone decarboxylase family protein, partial [Vicinamibacterales bacterium]